MKLWQSIKAHFVAAGTYLNLGGELDMEGWFEQMEQDKINGPVNTAPAGRRIHVAYSDPEMQKRHDAGLPVLDECSCGEKLVVAVNLGSGLNPDEYGCAPVQEDLTLRHYKLRAMHLGWDEKTNGHPVEWLLAKTYRVGYEDAIHRDGRVLVNAQLLSEAADAVQVLAESQSDSESGVWWSKHYGTLAGEFRRMLAKAHKSKG